MPSLRFIFDRIHEFINSFLNFCSFGFISRRSSLNANSHNNPAAAPAVNVRSTNFQSSLRSYFGAGCLNNSSDSEHDNTYGYFENRRRSQRSLEGNNETTTTTATTTTKTPTLSIASEAVAHSYEDITQPNYHNYLWLSSQWDQTDLVASFYFLPNWVQHFKGPFHSDINPRPDENLNSSADSSRRETSQVFKFILDKVLWKKERETCRSFVDFIYKIFSISI